jgi:hypothetical protein
LPDARAHFVAAITRSLAGAEAARRDA